MNCKYISLLLVLAMVLSLCACAKNAPQPADAALPEEIPTEAAAPAGNPHDSVTVLYTNDVHCSVDLNMTYQSVAAIKTAMTAQGQNVVLVDCGDSIQGKAMGTLSDGEYIITLMNAVGYDLAIPGNHEFDFGSEQLFALIEKANFPYLSANITTIDGKQCFQPYAIRELGGWKIAFVGATTPETMISTRPSNYKDADGNPLYAFCQGNNGQDLYDAIQSAVDSARAEGADFVILMGHLGIAQASHPWTSSDVIEHTTGIDVVLDAHSHTVLEQETVKNAENKPVILTSTGTELANIGLLTISAEGKVSSQLLNTDSYTNAFSEIQASLNEKTNEIVGHTDAVLCIKDPATGLRMVRQAETNLGDLVTDGMRHLADTDIAMLNGGAFRADIPVGDITSGHILGVHPFNNTIAVRRLSGQAILDALEMGASSLPGEAGSFLQVSGLSYTIDTTIPSSVKKDENNNFVGVEGERRVKDVLVNGEPIDPEAIYTVASNSFMMVEGGDGMTMLMDGELIANEIALDNQCLMIFIRDVLGGVVGEAYADPYGQGRITILE